MFKKMVLFAVLILSLSISISAMAQTAVVGYWLPVAVEHTPTRYVSVEWHPLYENSTWSYVVFDVLTDGTYKAKAVTTKTKWSGKSERGHIAVYAIRTGATRAEGAEVLDNTPIE